MNELKIDVKRTVQRVMSASGNKVKQRPRIQQTIPVSSGLSRAELDQRSDGVVHVDRKYFRQNISEIASDSNTQRTLRNNAALNTYGNRRNINSRTQETRNAEISRSAVDSNQVTQKKVSKNGLGIAQTEEGVLISKTGNERNYTLHISEPDGGSIQAKFQNGRLRKYTAKSATGFETNCSNQADGNWSKYVEKDSNGNETIWSWENGHVAEVLTKNNGETVVLKSPSDGVSRTVGLPNGGKRYIEDYSQNRRIICDYDKNGNWTSYTEMIGNIKMTRKFDEIGRIVTEF